MHPKARIQLLEKLMAYLSRQPEAASETQLRRLTEAFLQLHFSAIKRLLVAELDKLLAYRNRLNEEKHVLTALGSRQRQAAIWQIREDSFGEEAQIIWLDQWQAQKFEQALTELDARQMSWQETTREFINSAKELFGGTDQDYIPGKQQELVTQLMSMSSIQQQLQQLETEEQWQVLSEIRRNLGMDDAALSRWRTLDKARSKRHQLGVEYLQRRASILTSTVTPQHQGLLLQELRKQLFAEEADIIAGEEQRGYFRFENPQIIGVN